MNATFYTLADKRFFIGAVALLNSLRLTGNEGDVVVLDLGLTPRQRDILSQEAIVIDRSPDLAGRSAWLIKPYAATLDPQGVVVIVDSDMIITHSLDHLIEAAAAGQICVFPDPDENRWFAEWQTSLALEVPLRHRGYVNTGFVVLSADRQGDLLQRWWTLTSMLRYPPSEPLTYGDQDVLNALLMSEVAQDDIARQPGLQAAYPTWQPVKVEDPQKVLCSHSGVTTMLLHYDEAGRPKPWEPRSWINVRRNAFVRLLPRLLFAPDVPVRVGAEDVPMWLRPTNAGRASSVFLDGVNATGSVLAKGFPTPVRRRLSRLRHKG